MTGSNDGQSRLNANPFGQPQSNDESISWARTVASADPPTSNSDPPDSPHDPRSNSVAPVASPKSKNAIAFAEPKSTIEPESSLQPTESTAHAGIDLVKSVTHAARQKLHLDSIKTSGPSKLFNPTNVRVHVKWEDDDARKDVPGGITHERAYLWRSRDNRKGRNSISVPTAAATAPSQGARFRFNLVQGLKGIWRMCYTFTYWDMAFWCGFSYSIGSILFIIDSAWALIEVIRPGSQPENLTTYGAPLCFFIGALFYQVGAVTAYLEAINDGSFQGSAMRRFLDGNEERSKQMVDDKIHAFFGRVFHSHRDERTADLAADAVDPEAGWKARDRKERPGSLYPTGKKPGPRRGGIDLGETEDKETGSVYDSFRWWPSLHALRTHHVYEIGYVACSIQLFGATLYGICGVVTLPGILSSLANWQAEGAYWVPQIVASVCFLTASILFTLETQERWWRPEPAVIGWWIGVWATIGSIGFLLTGIFGSASFDIEWAEEQADVSSLWGSSAYLISSLLQWYEATNKNPIGELFDEPGEMKSFQVHPI